MNPSEAIRDGMMVYSADGKKLGKVIRHDHDGMVVEKGIFFKKDYLVSYPPAARVEGDKIWLGVREAELPRVDLDDQDEVRGARMPRKGSDRPEIAAAGGDPGDADVRAGSANPPDPNGVVVVVVEEEVVVAAGGTGNETDDQGMFSPGRGTDPSTRS